MGSAAAMAFVAQNIPDRTKNVIIIAGLGGVAYVAYKTYVVVSAPFKAFSDLFAGCDEECQKARHEADVAYAGTHMIGAEDVRNQVYFGNHQDPNKLIEEHFVKQAEADKNIKAPEVTVREKMVDSIMTSDDGIFWKHKTADYCNKHSEDKEIWVGEFFNRHKLGSKIGFNNYTGSYSVTCAEYELFKQRQAEH